MYVVGYYSGIVSWPAVEAAQGRFSGLLDSQTPIEPVVHSEHHAEPGSVRFYLFLFLAAGMLDPS